MALPETRNKTFADGVTPVDAATLNDLQDCIIAQKHATRSIPIPACAFQKISGTGTLGAGQWAGVCEIAAPLEIPAGETIESIAFSYNRGGAGNVVLKLGVRNLITGAAAVVTTLVTDATGAAWEVDTWDTAELLGAGVDTTPDDGVAYWIQMAGDNAANILGGAVLKTKKL